MASGAFVSADACSDIVVALAFRYNSKQKDVFSLRPSVAWNGQWNDGGTIVAATIPEKPPSHAPDSTLDALAKCARWMGVTSGDVCFRTRRIFVKILGARHSPCRGAKERIESGDDKNETGWLGR